VRKEVIPRERAAFSEALARAAEGTGLPEVDRTTYVWDGDVLAFEDRGARGTRGFVHEPGTFVPMLQLEGGRVYAYVNDHLGAPRELIDQEGRVAWSVVCSAWGAVREVWRDPTAVAQVESPFRLLGHLCDDETGLFYTRYRYFDPSTARWMSPDPLGYWGGLNLQAFDGSPTTDVDPFGLACKYVVYVLVKNGKVVYVGITEQNPKVRRAQHQRGGTYTNAQGKKVTVKAKDFDEMRIIASADANGNDLSRRGARNIEGSILHHSKGKGVDGSGSQGDLLNTPRKSDKQYYHSYSDPPGDDGRVLLPKSDTDAKVTAAMANNTPYDPTTGTGTVVQ
jgi:RHS repeat-associated protein